MKKITLLTSDISNSGGTERAIINLANMLVSNYYVEIISFHNNQNKITTFYDLDSRVNLVSFQLKIDSVLINSINNYFYLKRFIKKNKPDVLIGTWYGINMILPFFKKKNIKVIGCEHSDFNTTPFFIKKVANYIYPHLNSIVVLSEMAKAKLINHNRNVTVIPNSLPFKVENVSELVNKRILMVGRLVEVKGYERVITLAKTLQVNYPDWKIDIFGDGDQKESLINQFKQENLLNISIFKSVKDIKKEYLNSAIYLSTSYNEAMPMVFLEAMSCGLPIVSYKNEGALCLISDKIDGLIVNNEKELLLAVKKMIENITLRKRMGIKGIEKSKYYTEENIKKLWISLLNGI